MKDEKESLNKLLIENLRILMKIN